MYTHTLYFGRELTAHYSRFIANADFVAKRQQRRGFFLCFVELLLVSQRCSYRSEEHFRNRCGSKVNRTKV